MQYTTIKMGEQEFKLRLTGNTIGALEKRLNDNPVNILMEMQKGSLPMVSKLLLILHASMQKFHHGMTEAKVNDLYDEYVDTGKASTDLVTELLEVFKISGFLPQTKEEETKTEQASQ